MFYFIQFWPTHFFVYGLIPYFTAKLQDVQYDVASFRPERGSGQQWSFRQFTSDTGLVHVSALLFENVYSIYSIKRRSRISAAF